MNMGFIWEMIIVVLLCFLLPPFYRFAHKIIMKTWWDKFDD